MAHILRYFGIWFVAAVLSGLILFLLNGSASALDPGIERGRMEACEKVDGGFSKDTKETCIADVPRALERTVSEARSSLLYWHFVTALAFLIPGLIFMVKAVMKAAKAGTPTDYRSLRPDWTIYLAVTLAIGVIAGVFAHGGLFDAWAKTLSPGRGWGIPATLTVMWAAIYWLGTRLSTPDKMQPSIPGG